MPRFRIVELKYDFNFTSYLIYYKLTNETIDTVIYIYIRLYIHSFVSIHSDGHGPSDVKVECFVTGMSVLPASQNIYSI